MGLLVPFEALWVGIHRLHRHRLLAPGAGGRFLADRAFAAAPGLRFREPAAIGPDV